MPAIAITELICLYFVGVVTYGLWHQHDQRKSTFYIVLTLVCNMLALLSDAVSRCISAENMYDVKAMVVLMLAYFLGNCSFFPFILYCRAYIEERMAIGKWVLRIPLIVSAIIVLINMINYVAGSLMMKEYMKNPAAYNPEKYNIVFSVLPVISGGLMLFVLLYLPFIAIRRRKIIGFQPAALMGIFGVFPLVASYLFYDYIVIAGSMSLVIVAVIMQNTFAFERERNQKLLKEKADELEALNRELENAKAMAEASSEFKTIFLNNMSHDIRTPMNAIMGFTKLMEKSKDDPQMVSDYLEKVNRSGEYLLSIINNVLEVARIDSGKEELDESFVNLNEMRGSLTPIFENEIIRKNLHFTTVMSNLEHPYIYADVPKVSEIAINLVGNAMKYTPEGGTIHMELNELPSEREGYAAFEMIVADNGIGMSSEFLEHIYDSFTRERNTTESKVIGTGLGMSIVKKLIDLMGGTIEIESEPGKGTRIRVVIYNRIVDNPGLYLEKKHENAQTAVDLKGKRILLVEDNELNAEIAVSILEEYGIVVELASDGIECIKKLDGVAEDYYDLILMDIQMPNMNGYDATKRIRSLQNTYKSEIPIVAMTANAFEEDKMKALEAGMNDHLGKPINVERLLKVLSDMLVCKQGNM